MLSDHRYRIFVRENADSLYRYAYHFLRNSMDAEDVLQESLLKLWDIRKRIAPSANPRAYMFRMIKNLCLDRLRRENRRSIHIQEHLSEQKVDPQLTETSDGKEQFAQIMQIIQNLPETQKEILLLRNIEGYSIKEIAEILDLKLNTVEVKLSRARRKVRAMYEKNMKRYES